MDMQAPQESIRLAAELLRNARYAVALTGAGVSTPSGIPDFRSHESGLWKRDDPMLVASLTVFRHRPKIFYNWLRPLAASMWQAQPNPAHLALAGLEKEGFLKALVTQNIDGLHQKAGSQNVVEVHGTMNTLSCTTCQDRHPMQDFIEPFLNENKLPHCPTCGNFLKPDIVLFEEMLPLEAWVQAQQHCEAADLLVVVGSSLEVMPAGSLPLYALENGARLVINNLTPTHLNDRAALLLPYDAANTLPQVLEQTISG